MDPDTTYSSIWNYMKPTAKYPDKIANSNNFRKVGRRNGKNYYSEFNSTVAEKILNFWSNEKDIILDPFAGRTRAIISATKNRKYIGFEISKTVHDSIIENLSDKQYTFPPIIYNDDSNNLDLYQLPQCDLIFSCPPYWNQERYESCPGQLSDFKKYPEFLSRYKNIIQKSVRFLKPNGFVILVVGDFRRDGKYYTFHKDTIEIMESLGLQLHDLVILQSVTPDIAVRRFGFFKKYKFTAKVHEYLLVFKN